MPLLSLCRTFSRFPGHVLKRRLHIGRNVYIDRRASFDFRSERSRPPSGVLRIGDGSTICCGAIICLYGGNVTIGRNCYIGPYSVIYGHGDVAIGDNVLIANHATIVSSAHNYADASVLIALQGELFLPVVIEDDVWIGSGARILAGISLSTGVVVGANSVVTHSFEPFSVVYGAPARLYRYRCTAEDLPSVGLSI